MNRRQDNEYIKAIISAGSISSAAENLGISQPALSAELFQQGEIITITEICNLLRTRITRQKEFACRNALEVLEVGSALWSDGNDPVPSCFCLFSTDAVRIIYVVCGHLEQLTNAHTSIDEHEDYLCRF